MPARIDHFRIRDILFPERTDRPAVAGQFQGHFKPGRPPRQNQLLPLLIVGPKRLCLPTDKAVPEKHRHIPRQHPDDHLLWYEATTQRSQPNRTVTISNQFESKTKLGLGPIGALLAPAFKGTLPDGKPPLPQTIDHYLLYHVTQASGRKRPPVILTDQLDANTKFKIITVRYFGIPVIKFHKNKFTPPNGSYVNPDDHLTVYLVALDDDREQRHRRDLADQFVQGKEIEIINTVFLAVPTTKIDFSPKPPGGPRKAR
jgi:hypothetical protein